MSTPSVDVPDGPNDQAITLDHRRDTFNRAYGEKHPAVSGLRRMRMSVPTLPPLFVPNAIILGDEADIGINRALVRPAPQGLLIEMQAYPDMRAGDVIELFMHPQALITPPTPVKTATLGIGREGINIPLYVPAQLVEEGRLVLYGRVTRAGTQEVEETPRLSVWCKLSLPAGPDLRPDDPWHSELSAPQVLQRIDTATLGEFVHVSIAPYPGMAEGDSLWLYFGLQKVEYKVQAQNIGQAMSVHVPAEVLRLAGDSDALALYYRVVDRLKNVSEKASARAFVQVRLGSNLLDAPWIFDAGVAQVIDTRRLGEADVMLSVRVDAVNFKPGDELEVVGDGRGAFGQLVDIRPARQTIVGVGKTYTFVLPNSQVQRLARGLLMLHYKVRRANVLVRQSLHRYIDVLGRAPELPKPVVVEAVNDKVDPTLTRCTITVSYPSMSMGDWVELFFHGLTSAGHVYVWQVGRSVSRNEALRQRLTFAVEGEHIAALDGGSLQPRYEVTNDELPSPLESQRGWVHVGELHAELAPPAVPAVDDDDRLSQANIGEGVTVTVPADPSILPGSTVMVRWAGDTAAGSSEGLASAWVCTVPPPVAQACVGQSVEITYVIRDPDGRIRASLPYTLWIMADAPIVLSAPVTLDVEGTAIDPTRFPSGARFQASYQGMLAGDEVVMRLTGKQAHASPALRVAAFQPVVFTVANEVLRANAGDLIQLTYSVVRKGRPVLYSPPLTLEVLNALGVAESPLELNGLSVKVDGWTATRVTSLGNTATRVASGGVAPYFYASNNPAVASVTAAGLVTGNRNGAAVITVTDKRGQQVSYPVRVSNVYRLVHNWGPVDHRQAVAWMTSLGNAEPCSAQAVADLQRVYGRTLLTGGYWHFWLCEKNGCGGSGFAFYHATHQAVFCADYFNGNIHAAWCIQRT